MTTYAPKVDECLWALACDGWKPAQIRHALATDEELISELGGPIDMPARKLSEKLRRLREDRGDPRRGIVAGQELKAIEEMRLKTLAWAGRQLNKLQGLESPDAAERKAAIDFLTLIQRTESGLRESHRIKDPQRQNAARLRHVAPKISLLDEKAKAEEARAQDPRDIGSSNGRHLS